MTHSEPTSRPDHAQDAIDSTQMALDEAKAFTAAEQPESLLTAVNLLTETVQTLSDRLTVTEEQRKRTWLIQIAVVMIFVVVFGGGAIQWNRVSGAVDGNVENAIQACENANETRAANRALWDYILTLSSRDADPAAEQTLDEFKAWIDVLYQPHDCNDLGREYLIPPPPTLSPVSGPV